MNMSDFFQHVSPALAFTMAVIAFAIVGGFVFDLLATALAALSAIRGAGHSWSSPTHDREPSSGGRIGSHHAVTVVTHGAREAR